MPPRKKNTEGTQSIKRSSKSADDLLKKIGKATAPVEKKLPAKRKPRVKLNKDDRKFYSVSGEISVQIVERPPLTAKGDGFESPALVVDKIGNAFDRGVIQLDVNDTTSVALLDAKQVEILLKVLRVAPNSVREQKEWSTDEEDT